MTQCHLFKKRETLEAVNAKRCVWVVGKLGEIQRLFRKFRLSNSAKQGSSTKGKLCAERRAQK